MTPLMTAAFLLVLLPIACAGMALLVYTERPQCVLGRFEMGVPCESRSSIR